MLRDVEPVDGRQLRRDLRNLLTETLGGEHIHVLAPEVEAFEGAQTTATITTFRIGQPVGAIGFRPVESVADLGELTMPVNPVAYSRLIETTGGSRSSAPACRCRQATSNWASSSVYTEEQ